MKVSFKSDIKPDLYKVYSLKAKDREFVDKKFNRLQS